MNLNNIAKINWNIKAEPKDGISLDELIYKMKELGNNIIEINYKENYILINQGEQEFKNNYIEGK